jgi:hypothetical protein
MIVTDLPAGTAGTSVTIMNQRPLPACPSWRLGRLNRRAHPPSLSARPPRTRPDALQPGRDSPRPRPDAHDHRHLHHVVARLRGQHPPHHWPVRGLHLGPEPPDPATSLLGRPRRHLPGRPGARQRLRQRLREPLGPSVVATGPAWAPAGPLRPLAVLAWLPRPAARLAGQPSAARVPFPARASPACPASLARVQGAPRLPARLARPAPVRRPPRPAGPARLIVISRPRGRQRDPHGQERPNPMTRTGDNIRPGQVARHRGGVRQRPEPGRPAPGGHGRYR